MSLVMDVARIRPIAWFLSLAGANALLIYLQAPLFDHTISALGLEFYGKLGSRSLALGLTRAAGLAVALTLFAGALNLARIRMRL